MKVQLICLLPVNFFSPSIAVEFRQLEPSFRPNLIQLSQDHGTSLPIFHLRGFRWTPLLCRCTPLYVPVYADTSETMFTAGGNLFQVKGCPYVLSEEQAMARQRDVSQGGNYIELHPVGAGKILEIVAARLRMGCEA